MAADADDDDHRKDKENPIFRFPHETSLHGWSFAFRPGQNCLLSFLWLCVITVCTVSTVYLVAIDLQDYMQATISTSLESTTVPLSEVHFPAVTICNTNDIGRSFIYALMEDASLSNYTYEDIQVAVNFLLHGEVHEEFEEYDIKKEHEMNRLAQMIVNSTTYEQLFDEFLYMATHHKAGLAGEETITKWHYISKEANWTPREKLKLTYMSEVASQVNDLDMVPQVMYQKGGPLIYAKGFDTDVSETCVWLMGLAEPPKTRTEMFAKENWAKGVKNGVMNGLRVLLDTEGFDYTHSMWANQGFLVSVGHHEDIALLKFTGVLIHPGTYVQIGVTPTLYNMTDMAKWRFTPEERQCYFDEEVMLKYINGSFRYGLGNCLYETAIQKSMLKCGCSPKLLTGDTSSVCALGKAKDCLNQVLGSIGADPYFVDSNDGMVKQCLPACVAENLALVTSDLAFANPNTLHHSEQFCPIMQKLDRSCGGYKRRALMEYQPELCPTLEEVHEIYGERCNDILHELDLHENDPLMIKLRMNIFSYAEKNMAMVVVYVRDPYATRYVTGERMGAISFTGSIGGLMGLFLGGSAMSLIEVVYFCFVGAIHYLVGVAGRAVRGGNDDDAEFGTAKRARNGKPANKVGGQNGNFIKVSEQPKTGSESGFHM